MPLTPEQAAIGCGDCVNEEDGWLKYRVSFTVPIPDDPGERVDFVGEFITRSAPVLPSVGDGIWLNEVGITPAQRAQAYDANPDDSEPGNYYRVQSIVFLYSHWRRRVHETHIEITIEPADCLED